MIYKKIGIIFFIIFAIAGTWLNIWFPVLIFLPFWLTNTFHRWKILFQYPYLIKTSVKLTFTLFLVQWILFRYEWPWVAAFLLYWWIAGWIKVQMMQYFHEKKSKDTKSIWIRRGIAFSVLLLLAILIVNEAYFYISLLVSVYWYLGVRRYKIERSFASIKSHNFQSWFFLLWEFFTFVSIYFATHGILSKNLTMLCIPLAWFCIHSLIEDKETLVSMQKENQDKILDVPEKSSIALSPKKKILPLYKFSIFLSKNIVSLLLVLGVLFVFTGVVVFLRSHWQGYKYWVFGTFLACTLACFISAYSILIKNKWVHKIAFTILLLGSVFFPLNFYFAVKVGLLQDHGNRYIVFWLTTFLFSWNAWLLRSNLFTLIATFLSIWAHFLTLEKFLAPCYEIYPLFLSLHALAFLLPAYYTQKKSLPFLPMILQGAANLLYLDAVLGCIFWWKTETFAWVMVFGIILGMLQIQFFIQAHLQIFSCILASLSIFFAMAAFSNLAGIAIFWQGIIPVIGPFAMLLFLPYSCNFFPKKGVSLIQIVSLAIVPIVFFIYTILGAYTSLIHNSAFLAFPFLSVLGYIAINRYFQSHFITSMAIAMNGLFLISLYQQNTKISYFTWIVLFLLWGLFLAALAQFPIFRKKNWIEKPLYYASHIVVLSILCFTGVWGKELYQEHFGILSLILIFSLCFYTFYAFYLQRKDMMVMGTLLLFFLGILHARQQNLNWQYLYLLVTGLGALIGSLGVFFQKKISVFQVFFIAGALLVFAFSFLSFFTSLGHDWTNQFRGYDWTTQSTLFLGVFFFGFCFALKKSSIYSSLSLLSFTAGFFLHFYQKIDFYSWGILFLFLAILSLILAQYFSYRGSSLGKIFGIYGIVVGLICLVQFLIYWNYYYSINFKVGILFTFLLFFMSAALWSYLPSALTGYTLFVFAYIHCIFWLPKNLYAFEYALYFIPLAIGILAFNKKISEDSLFKKISFIVAQATVFFLLAIPFLIPGATPGALVSTFVMALAFVYYFIYICFYRQPFYCYLCSLLFLACLLAGLFASKKFYGNEMTFLLSLGNLFLLILAYTIKKRADIFLALPIFHVNILCSLGLIVSVLVQGKIVYSTLMTMAVCSLSFGILSFWPIEKLWLNKKTFAYFSVVLFSIAYYLMLEKLSLYTNFVEFQYILLSFFSLCLALLLHKTDFFQAFLFITIVSPILAFSKAQSSFSLSLLLCFSSVFYGIVAHKIQDKIFSFLSIVFITMSFYSLGFSYSWTIKNFMLGSILFSQVLFYLATILKNKLPENWKESILKNACICQIVFLFLFIGIPHSQLYYPIFLGIVSAISLFFLYFLTQRHLLLASLSFFISYYATLLSWSVYVWEFYSVPLGLFFLLFGYILEKSSKEGDFHNDCFLLGIILILLPTLIQSYSGWYNHLAPLGISPYQHLYHSLFLSLESLAVLLYGVVKKRLIFFFSGVSFLISDILLLIFAYVNFGTIPQAIWWATLGASLIMGAWLLEYRKETLKRFYGYIKKQGKDSALTLKTWK